MVDTSGKPNLHFRKKPVVIEAFQMTRDARSKVKIWPQWLQDGWHKHWDTTGSVFPSAYSNSDGTDELMIHTLEGNHRVSFDDWIILGVSGELYPCKPDIFAATYEPA